MNLRDLFQAIPAPRRLVLYRSADQCVFRIEDITPERVFAVKNLLDARELDAVDGLFPVPAPHRERERRYRSRPD